MTEEKKLVVELKDLYQAGIVVRDLEKSIKFYEEIFGIEDWAVLNAGEMLTTLIYKGKPVENPSFLVGLNMVGNMQLELIQPVSKDLPYYDFLEEHGEGLHHVGHVHVPDIDQAVKDLAEQGYPCIFEGGSSFTRFAYVDMSDTLGVIVELVESSGEK